MPYRTVVAVYFFLQGLCAASWTAQIPALQLRLGLSHAQLGTVLLGLSGGTLCAMPLAGAALARARGPWTLVAGALAHASGLCLLSLATGPLALALALLAFGCANTWVQVAVNQHALAVQAQQGRSVMAGYHGCWSVAAALAALGVYATGRAGLAPALHLQGVAGLAAATALVAARLGQTAALPVDWTSSGPSPARGVPRQLWALGLVTAGAMAVEAVAFDWGAVLYRQVLGGDERRAGLGYAALMLGMTSGRLVADRAADRARSGGVLALLAAAVATGLTVVALSEAPGGVLCGLALAGLGLSAMVPLLLGRCGGFAEVSPARALAWTSAVGAVGALAGPTALGWSAHAVGLRPAFAATAGVAALVGVAGERLLRHRAAPAPRPSRAGAHWHNAS